MAATDTDAEQPISEQEIKEPLKIDVQIDVTSTCERHVVVSIPSAEVARYRQESFDEVVPKAELPGFRAGKAPRKLVESRLKEQVDEQVKNSLVMDSLQQVTEGDHFSAISEPDFDYDVITLPDEGDFKYEFRIEVRPEFETPKWEGLKLERPICELTDAHVDAHLSRTLRRFMNGEPVDGPCALGDNVVLHGKFRVEDKEISEFEEQSVLVQKRLSFGDAILEDFDQLIVGKAEGDSFQAKLTLSDSAAREELRGQEIDAEFEIHEVRRIEIDELGPSELDKLGFEDIEELRKFVRSELQQQFEYHQHQALRKQVVDELTKDAEWEMPESLVRKQTNRELQRMMLELQT